MGYLTNVLAEDGLALPGLGPGPLNTEIRLLKLGLNDLKPRCKALAIGRNLLESILVLLEVLARESGAAFGFGSPLIRMHVGRASDGAELSRERPGQRRLA